jgi:hypothetical protein
MHYLGQTKEHPMKGIVLFIALAMTAGVASAQPDGVRVRGGVRLQVTDGEGDWTRDRYDRYDRSHFARDFRGRWMSLARGYSARSERQFIMVRGERLSKLRIEADRGAPVIQKIAIEFGNGSMQAVELDMRLRRGTGEVIDLNGDTRRVRRIIVYTDGASRGSYSVYGA